MRTLSPSWRRVLEGSWIMILALTVGLVVLYVDNKRTRDCIANYMVADSVATQARATIAETERQFFKSTLRTVMTDPDAKKRVAAINAYVALLDKDDEVRKANPIRQVPTECD